MIAIDTNVLVRILVDDKEEHPQVTCARQFAKKHLKLFIPQIVQIELVWVLNVAYELEKTNIIPVLQHLYENAAFILQRVKQFETALHLYQTTHVGFSDCLIQIESQEENCKVVTFDKKFSKLPGVNLLVPSIGNNS